MLMETLLDFDLVSLGVCNRLIPPLIFQRQHMHDMCLNHAMRMSGDIHWQWVTEAVDSNFYIIDAVCVDIHCLNPSEFLNVWGFFGVTILPVTVSTENKMAFGTWLSVWRVPSSMLGLKNKILNSGRLVKFFKCPIKIKNKIFTRKKYMGGLDK